MSDLHNVQSILEKEVLEGRRARKTQEKILIAVSLLLCISFSTIYYSVSQFNPGFIFDWLFVKGHDKVASINTHLKDAAPSAASLVSQKVSEAPAKLSAQFQREFNPLIDNLALTIKKDLQRYLNDLQVAARKEQPSSVNVSLLDAEFNKMLHFAHRDIINAIDSFYYQNSATMRELNAELQHLAHSKKLSKEDALRREVIGAWLTILDQKGATWAVSW